MSRRFLIVLLLLVSLPIGVAARAVSSSPPDWELAIITAGPSGATGLELLVEHDGYVRDPRQPLVLGFGFRDFKSGFYFIDADAFTPYRYSATTTTKQLGGLHVSYGAHFKPGAHHFDLATGASEDKLAPGQRIAILAFVGGGTLPLKPRVSLSTKTGTVTMQFVRGHGSEVWQMSPTVGGRGIALVTPNA